MGREQSVGSCGEANLVCASCAFAEQGQALEYLGSRARTVVRAMGRMAYRLSCRIEVKYSGSTPKGCAAEANARLIKEASSCGLSAVDVCGSSCRCFRASCFSCFLRCSREGLLRLLSQRHRQGRGDFGGRGLMRGTFSSLLHFQSILKELAIWLGLG